MAEQVEMDAARADRVDDWMPRGAMRGLLWWPPVAFLIAIAVPGAGLLWIVTAGLVLAAAGAASALVSRHRRRERAGAPAAPLHLEMPNRSVGRAA